jgi:glucose/galactose transporter
VANRIVTPYLILTIRLVLLAIGIRYSSLPEISAEDNVTEGGNDKKSIWEYPHAIAGAFAIFFYVGVEVMAGDIIGTFGKNLGFSINESKYFTSFTLFAMLIGYVVNLILIPKFIKQEQWLNISVIIGIVLTIAAFATSGMTAVYCVAALGFANAVMWPAIFPLGIDGLGRWTQFGSALLVMGIAGGAILPPLYGWLSEHLGFQLAFLSTILPCYLYIGWFALRGHRLGRH